MQMTKPHITLLASPGMGHLIPVLKLGKCFVTHLDVQVTVFVVASDASDVESQLCDSPNSNLLNIILLPTIDISNLVDTDTSVSEKIVAMMHESLPALRSAISTMKSRPMALIVDLFGTEAMDVADEFGMLKYVFIASNAWFLAALLYAPVADKKLLIDEHVNLKKPLKIPGCTPIRFEDTLEPFQYPNDPAYDGFSNVGINMSMSDGILVNTWEELESKTLGALRDRNMLGCVTKVPVYAIGPLVRPVASSSISKSAQGLDWLDRQPNESVLYVSFGSGGTLSATQMIELAWGLELSRQRFIWVVRPPMENDVSGSFFTVGNIASAGTLDYLPDGFFTRTHNMGIIVPMWAPQTEILSHPSVGGFLSHCGWNSTMESIVNGVPMIAWPLYSEQKMNASMLTEEIGVAVRSTELPTENLVMREEIEMLVRKVMEDKQGHSIRSRVKELKYSAQKAISKGGSSYNSLSQFAKKCEISLQGLEAMGQGA